MTEQSPIAWAVYGGKSGVLRYVLQDEERVFELTESGYISRPLFEHPVPTPPADDVREALEKLIDLHDPRGLARPVGAVKAILAAFEVRPRGTVTDAEVEWEYGAQHSQGVDAARDRAEAVRWVREFEARDHRLRPEVRGRVKLLRRRRASEWEPVEAAREARS